MNEGGAISVLGAGLVSLAVFIGVVALGAGRLLAASAQVQTAADAAALAAAPATFLGPDAVKVAALLAAENGARLVACDCGIDRTPVVRVVRVEVAAFVDAGLLGVHEVRASARAEFDP